MNSFWRAVLINFAIVYALAILTLTTGDTSGLLILPILVAVFEFFVSLPFLLLPKTRRAGQIMLAASGLIFLIGLGVCTVLPYNLNMH